MQPLPRSLDPLPDESLSGYLLRLAHRLGLAPSQLATRCGLTGSHRSAGALLHLPDPARSAFATATRLTPAEATGLTLASFRSSYPLPAPDPAGRHPAGNTHPDRWVLTPATRYCPACLAGDGSQIQHAHGGCWRRTWHLPVAFACPRHLRLLSARCPGCGQATHHGHPGAHARPLLLPSMNAPGLHPACCRATLTPGAGRRPPTCCPTRLDTPGEAPGTPAAGEGILDLQQHLLDLLHTDPPPAATSGGQPTTATGYFTDLRLLTLLICSSWPATRHLAPSPALADAVEAHTAHQRQATADLATRTPASRRLPLLDTPPPDPAASAGLLAIAAQLLALPSPGELREHLRPLLPASTRQAGRTPWGRLMSTSATTCSAALREAGGPLLSSFNRTGPAGRRRPTLHPARLHPRHIPAFLPTDWYDRHLGHIGHLGGIDTTTLRRTAAVRLVQMTDGGSTGQAAAYLGISSSGAPHSTARVRDWARLQADPDAFDTALHDLAGELDSAPTLVDYHHRRTALRRWFLDEPTWHELTSHLPPSAPHTQPLLDDRTRQTASIFVWTLVTQGEHHFAPRPLEAAQPDHARQSWARRRTTTWYQLSRPGPLPHYARLRNLLIPHARQLAMEIDRHATP